MIEEKLVKRNIAEQSKWINDPDPRPWVVHETQTVQWQMGWQQKCLAKGRDMAPGGEKSPQVTIDTGNNHPLK